MGYYREQYEIYRDYQVRIEQVEEDLEWDGAWSDATVSERIDMLPDVEARKNELRDERADALSPEFAVIADELDSTDYLASLYSVYEATGFFDEEEAAVRSGVDRDFCKSVRDDQGNRRYIPAWMRGVLQRKWGENPRCFYCAEKPQEQWDHYVPICRGGEHIPENLRPSCEACNRAKHMADPEVWLSQRTA